MKILVTGGAGFIGSNFILYWFKNHPQDSIVNLDKLTYAGNLENLKSIQDNPNYKFIQGDICDTKVVNDAMQGIDIVVHFAAESHVDRSITDPSEFVRTNVLGTQVLLEAALSNKIKKFHHVSTDEVYGSLNLEDKNIFNERTAYNPRSPYSASKAGSDHLVKAYYHTYNLPITISNCSNNFGPYQFPEKLIALAITNLLEEKKVPVYGDGLYVRDWLYVEDHCRAIDIILEKGKIGETYCVGGLTEDISNLEVIKKILKLLGKDESSMESVKDRPGHDRRYALDWTKIRTELGWEPLHGFDEWLEKTVQWYQQNREWWKNVKNGEYKEYYKKQYSK
ncbi:MAG TPA: dTDP-glucose 4,6-dehydratase [Patescibacteria group bacterium]|jgi:dTDP-glucose 4,6-dehydratase|nr:dTDP-glucose 4,6-dehydratase [Patescibacteria group bacterium]